MLGFLFDVYCKLETVSRGSKFEFWNVPYHKPNFHIFGSNYVAFRLQFENPLQNGWIKRNLKLWLLKSISSLWSCIVNCIYYMWAYNNVQVRCLFILTVCVHCDVIKSRCMTAICLNSLLVFHCTEHFLFLLFYSVTRHTAHTCTHNNTKKKTGDNMYIKSEYKDNYL